MIEWEFDVDSEQVDLDRLHRELSDIPAIVALSYIRTLAQKAPIVYQRYKNIEKQRRGKYQVWDWNEIDRFLPTNNHTQKTKEINV